MRAWLAILSERHPNVRWVPVVDHTEQTPGSADSATVWEVQ
jgi:hypothetical protein